MKRPVYKYAQDGTYICSYRNTTEAARDIRCDESSIRKAKDKVRFIKGYYWSSAKHDKLPYSSNENPENIKFRIKQYKGLQKQQDMNRIRNKEFRHIARTDTAIEEIGKGIIDKFHSVEWHAPFVQIEPIKGESSLIVHLSDLHLNELIDTPENKYNIHIASARLMEYAKEVQRLAVSYKADHITIAMTGDMINSDRRLDEVLNNAANRAIASLVATKLIAQFVQFLTAIAPVSIIAITGNESRIHDEYTYTDVGATDNYDYIIFNQLKLLLGGNSRVKFIDCDPLEAVIEVNGMNFLLMHGHTMKVADQKAIQNVIGKYASQGVKIDHILFGHVHYAMLTDLASRSSGLPGGGSYSNRGLHLIGRASQNIHIVTKNGKLRSIRIDLQNVDVEDRFEIEEFSEMYVSDFSDKLTKQGRSRFIVLQVSE